MRVSIPPDNDALLAECDVETFRATGPGGQNVNRRETAVRLRHRPTGVTVVCREERSQHRNRERAVERLRRRLQAMNRRRKPRIETRMPRSVREKILQAKKHRGEKKALRRKPPLPGE